MTDVTLKLSKPYMVYNPEKADKIVLPAEKGPLTVISGRAPTSLMLRRGVIRLLDKDNQPLKHYFVKSGVADVAGDVCAVSAEIIDAYTDMSKELAAEKRDAAKTQEDKDYYQMIFDEISLTGKAK
ncbi:MAG: hypothetical protein Q4F75_06595 [Pseudomonadota bacterium]|nr:hypothetical protein [Pseudomonadota bacterium]